MAVVLGTSSGFVRTAPTADPAGTDTVIDGASVVTKDTTPAGARTITEIGWYRGSGTNAANFEVALYSDVAGVASARLSVDATNSSTSAGWITTAVSWSITPGTAYWLAVQMDAHTGSSNIDTNVSGGSGIDRLTAQTTLADPYGGGAVLDADGMYAIYALVTGTEVAVTAGLGAATFAGFAPTVQTPRAMSPGVGAGTFTGFAPVWSSASAGSSFAGTPGTGLGTFTGLAPTVQTPRAMAPGVGVGIFTGLAPTVQTPRNVVPDVGAGTWTGLAATVQTPRVVGPDVGAGTFTGLAPTVQTPRNVTAGVGAGVFAGFAPTVSDGAGTSVNVVGDYGYAQFTGHRPTVTTVSRTSGNAVGASILLVWDVWGGLAKSSKKRTAEEKPKRVSRLRYEPVDAGHLPGRVWDGETEVSLTEIPPAVAFLAMEWMNE